MRSIESKLQDKGGKKVYCFVSYEIDSEEPSNPIYHFEFDRPLDIGICSLTKSIESPTIYLAKENYRKFRKNGFNVVFPKKIRKIPRKIRRKYDMNSLNIVTSEDVEEMKSVEKPQIDEESIVTYCFASYEKIYGKDRYSFPWNFHFESFGDYIPALETEKCSGMLGRGWAPSLDSAAQMYKEIIERGVKVIFPKSINELPDEILKHYRNTDIDILGHEDVSDIISLAES